MKISKGFFAYPSSPSSIGKTIETAVKDLPEFSTWAALDIVGRFISHEVLGGIDNSNCLVADISVLNFNVTYEIGYAIGQNKRVLLVRNKSISQPSPTIQEIGIFDTIGYKEYENSSELKAFLNETNKINPIDTKALINQRAPIYLQLTLHNTDWISHVVSRIKKARFIFRSFDPNESSRLSAYDAISQVSQSHGVIVPLLSSHSEGHQVHNLRAAFIAGLAAGMGKACCILQDGNDPVPLDCRDFVNITNHPKDIDYCIRDFAAQVMEAFQAGVQYRVEGPTTFIESLDLGASSAENEMRSLEEYYLKTDQFLKSLKGEAHLVVGRKGSGKSAIFLQVRDKERASGKNVVLDLKPDGYKLIKFKELILDSLEEGTFQHTIMAFWEYVLLLEICHKILETDIERHKHDHVLYEKYNTLAELYRADDYQTEGDFSERMSSLMEKITAEYRSKYSQEGNVRLSVAKITELLYLHDVKVLRENITEYLKHKEVVWLLFDNVDKGWSTSGLIHEDLLIVRTLIDATRKLERQFNKQNIQINFIVFLRNDVYELLVEETSDRGKEANVRLDWDDADLLREVLRLRINANNLDENYTFEQVWPKVCVSHMRSGEETSQFMIDRCLMRPRFLLNLITQCKSYAVNLGHEQIEEDDILKGLAAYSADLLTDISYEMRDILPDSQDVLYAFISTSSQLKLEDCQELLESYGIKPEDCEKIIELLLWYGFLGINSNREEKYIYSFNYNMQLMQGVIRKLGDGVEYCINPAFWPSLMIEA